MNQRYLSYFLLSLCAASGLHAATSLTVDFDPAGRYLYPLEFVDVNGNVNGYPGVIPDPNSAAVYGLASTWIADSVGKSSTDATILMNVNGPTASQTFITSSGVLVDALSTPEPGTMGLVGVALLLVGLARKRVRRNHLPRLQGLRISMPPLK